MGDVAIGILGPLVVTLDGQPHAVSSARQRALLAALATSVDGWTSIDGLVEAVWDGQAPPQARTTLQTYVSRLRSGLGPAVVEHGPAGYRVAEAVRTDVAALRTLVKAIAATATDQVAERGDLARKAIDLYRGEPLDEFADRAWFRPAVAELDAVRADVVDLAAEALLAAQSPQRALAMLERAVARDPWREPTQVLLVEALHAAGRSLDATRAADRYRRDLREETGLEPGPAFLAAEHLALDSDAPRRASDPPATRPGAEAPAGGSHPGAAPSMPRRAALARPTPLLGRDDDLAGLLEAMRSSRLTSLVGIGGVGKTRLMAEALHVDGGSETVVVDLSGADGQSAVSDVAAALGRRTGPVDDATVAELLQGRTVRLVLDNCEPVLAPIRSMARHVLLTCEGVRIVVTSRIRLGLPEERVVTLLPLAAASAEDPAAELFLDRLSRVRPDVDVEPADVVELCRALDGLPLALELAASRAGALGVEAVAERIGTVVGSLGPDEPNGSDGGPGTVARVLSWSVGALDGDARTLLTTLSAFHGDFDLDAAEQVASPVVAGDVSTLLARLIDASLVAPGVAPGHHRLLAVVRHLASEILRISGERAAVDRSHARWVADRAARVAREAVGPEEARLTTRLDALRAEAVAALGATPAADDEVAASIAEHLGTPLLYRPDASIAAAVVRAAQVARSGGRPPLRAAAARAAFLLGELDIAEALARDVLGGGADRTSATRAAHALGVVQLYRGTFEQAAASFTSALDDARTGAEELDARSGLALACCYAGASPTSELTRHRALAESLDSDTHRAFADFVEAETVSALDVEAAIALLDASTERAGSCGATFVWGLANTVLARLLLEHRPDEARSRLPELVDRWRTSATWPQLWTTLRMVAELLAHDGRHDVALMVLDAADADAAAPALVGDDRARVDSLRARLVDELGHDAAAGTASGARALGRARVLRRALDALDR